MKKLFYVGALVAALLVGCADQTSTEIDQAEEKAEEEREAQEKAEKAAQKDAEKEQKEAEKLAEEERQAQEKAEKDAEKEKSKLPEYTIDEERIDGSIWYLTISSPSTKKKDLKRLVEYTDNLAAEKTEKIDSIFVNVKTTNSVASTYAASGKVALTEFGLAQVGLDEINEYAFNYMVDESHKTTKEDLQSSNESYTAADVLKAFQDAGLPTTDARDNSHNCVDLECTTLITTEDVSIYEWPSVEKAVEVHGKSFGDAQLGTIIIRMNNKDLDLQLYVNELNKIITP